MKDYIIWGINDMKKNKKRLLISALVLLVACCGIAIYISFKDEKKVEAPATIGIENFKKINSINVRVGKDFYVKDEVKKLVIYDYNDNQISEYKNDYNNYELFGDKYIIVKNKNIKTIIDINGNVLVEGSQVKKSSDEKYILVSNAVYDNNMNKIYTLDFTGDFEYTAIFGGDLLIVQSYNKESKSIIVDLKESKVLWRDFEDSAPYLDNDELIYFEFIKDNKGYLLDARTKKILYEDITYDNSSYSSYGIFTYNGNSYYIDNAKIYGENTKINDKYVMKKDSCEVGYKLKDNKNKTIVNKCMLAYKILFDNAILGIKEDENILFYKDKEISGGYITLEGDLIRVGASVDLLDDGTTYKYYDKSLKQLDIDENTNITYKTKGVYDSFNYLTAKHYLLDSNLKKISDDVIYIDCQDLGYCVFAKETKEQYLYKDGKKVTDETFTNITINDEKIILETLFKTYIIEFGVDNNIELDFSIANNIDLDATINKYNLKDIEQKINENKELFKKYAYIIENNNMLLDYKKEVYDLFELIVDNKEYLDEFYFLYNLGRLNILKVDTLLDGKASGTYEEYKTTVNLASDDVSVLYHELVHFVDFSFNYNKGTTLYKCGSKYEVKEALPNAPEGCDYVNVPYTNYIIEAGAEAFTTKYLTKRIDSYSFATHFLVALEYIYGSNTISKWFLDDTNYFIKFLYDEFDDKETVKKIIDALNDTTSLSATYKDTEYLLDVLVGLYEEKNGGGYLSDKKFIMLLRLMVGSDDTKYYDKIMSLYKEDKGLTDLREELNFEIYAMFIEPIIINDKMYLSWYAWSDNPERKAVIFIDYDFTNSKVNNYKIFEK